MYNSPLDDTIQEHDTDITPLIEALIADNMNFNPNDEVADGLSYFHICVANNNMPLSKKLLNLGADINALDISGTKSPLLIAAAFGLTNITEWLLENGANPNITTKDGNTALHIGALKGNTTIISILMNHGADINAKNSDGLTPVDIAYKTLENTNISANLNSFLNGVKNNNINTAEYQANTKHILKTDNSDFNPSTLITLLKYAPDLSSTFHKENLFIHLGIMFDNIELIETLVDIGANINSAHNSASNLSRAIFNGNIKITELFLNKGCDPNGMSMDNGMPLILAAGNDDIRFLELLIQHGANVNNSNVYGLTALYTACNLGKLEMVEMLISNGANVNAQDIKGTGPLHLSVRKGFISITNKLIEAGANPNLEDIEGSTPLHISAILNDKVSMINLLLSGGDINQHLAKYDLTPISYLTCKDNNSIHLLAPYLKSANLDFSKSIEIVERSCPEHLDALNNFINLVDQHQEL